MNEEPNKAVENRRPDGTFGPGNNANPLGRPKGKSLKEYWKQRFSEMSDEEKLEFSKKVSPELLWQMAEGRPKQDTEMEHKGEINVNHLDEEQALRIIKRRTGGDTVPVPE